MYYYLTSTLLLCCVSMVACLELITLDGSQYISSSMITSPLHEQHYELGINFRTSLSSCVLFFASGVSGDYIALELIRGRLRYIANSGGLASKTTVEIIHSETNYADGNLHQVNVEIGEYTKLYTYTVINKTVKRSNDSIKHSKASDHRYDLDENAFYMGIPITERVNAKQILLSTRNFEGCLNVISFNKEDFTLSDIQNGKLGMKFNGKFTPGCNLRQPTFLKSFSKSTDDLKVYSHVNDKTFIVELHYRTYLQNGVLFQSISSKKSSAITLFLVNNSLQLKVNLTDKFRIQLFHNDKNADDGVWRRISVQVDSASVILAVDKDISRHDYNKSLELAFPNELKFGGSLDSHVGFIGCMKNILIGQDKSSINEVMKLSPDIIYEEKMCAMKDLCFPSRPCSNSGRCIQTENEETCDCTGSGFKGSTCAEEDDSHYKKTCSEYYDAGFKQNGIYTVKPGSSRPFKVNCDMNHPSGPMTIIKTNNQNKTFVFTGTAKDENFYFYQVSYKANKQQINHLISTSNFCRQYFRYDCYQSTLSNSNEKLRHTSSQLGVRWYTKSGSVRNYWNGESKEQIGCACGANGNCANSKLLCNCDMKDQRMRFDEGYITNRDDLPVTKIRVSILRTNHRSTFQMGHLECTNKIQPTKNTLGTILKPSKTDTSNYIPEVDIPTTGKSNDVSSNGIYHKGHNNNTIVNKKEEKKSFILIDSKLLYIIIVAVVILIVLFMLILIFKRRICCCYHEFKGKPQIIELYKEELTRNNNQNILSTLNNGSMNDPIMPLSHRMSNYPVSCSDSSVSTIDPGRYYQERDSDSYSLQSNLSVPKRGILKIKKDSIPHTRKSDDSISHTSNRSKDPLSVFSKNFSQNGDSEFNYELDSPDICSSMSPLKQKVLELSTNVNRKGLGNELYFHQDSNSSIQSSLSSNSSKDSELDSDADSNEVFTTNSELEPLTRCQRSKSVRFSDEESSLLRRSLLPDQRIRRITYDDNEESGELLFVDEQKTLV